MSGNGIGFNVLGNQIRFVGFPNEAEAFKKHELSAQIWLANKQLFPEVVGSDFSRQNNFTIFVDENIAINRINEIAQEFLARMFPGQ